MAPRKERVGVAKRKVNAVRKAKAVLLVGSKLERALCPSIGSKTVGAKVRKVATDLHNEHGATGIRPTYGGRAENKVAMSYSFILMGLVPRSLTSSWRS